MLSYGIGLTAYLLLMLNKTDNPEKMFALGQVQGILATVDRELGIEYKQPGFFD